MVSHGILVYIHTAKISFWTSWLGRLVSSVEAGKWFTFWNSCIMRWMFSPRGLASKKNTAIDGKNEGTLLKLSHHLLVYPILWVAIT